MCIQVPKYPSYGHGLELDEILDFFKGKNVTVAEIDHWYYHLIRGIKRNSTPMWLNQGEFRKRDIEKFGYPFEEEIMYQNGMKIKVKVNKDKEKEKE